MIGFNLISAVGKRLGLKIDEDNAALTSSVPYPPLMKQKTRPFRQFMTDDGLSTGSNDMRVAGSAGTPIQFWIPADDENDRYITNLSFVIADAGAVMNKFGNIIALTNGCRLFYEVGSGEEVNINDSLTSNFEFVRQSLIEPAFGQTTNAMRLSNVVGGSEAFVPVFDFTRLLPPHGIKLDAGTTQRLVLEVRDNTIGVDGFDALAYGFDRLPN